MPKDKKKTARSLAGPRRKNATPKPLRGPCFFKGCKFTGNRKHHCNMCELKGKKKIYTVQFCDVHMDHALEKMKAHVLLRHPALIPAHIGAELAGGSLPWTKRDLKPGKKKGR